MKTKNVLIPVAGVIASILIAFSTPPEHQLQMGVIAGLMAIALGVWQARGESKKPKYLPIFYGDDKGQLWPLPETQEPLKPKSAKQTTDRP